MRDPTIRADGDESGRRSLTHPAEDRLPDDFALDAPSSAQSSNREEIDRAGDAQDDAGDTSENPGEHEGVLDSLAPASALERHVRAARVSKKDSSAQAGGGDKEDWRTFDVSRALAALRSPNQEVRRRTLQKLHVRWYHATRTSMTQILQAAGAPSNAIADIASVVQGCLVCRDWYRPVPRNIATFRLSLAFNEEVQFDLLFYHSLIDEPGKLRNIAHLVDCCIRWSATGECESKEEEELTRKISTIWISIFGPMETLTLDEEAGMRHRHAVDWAEVNNIGLKFKAPRQKAWLVERHNELLRRGLHLTESQMVKEGIVMVFAIVLSIVTFMKNALTVVNTSTPYQALFGRQPALLPPLEGGYNGSIVDQARPHTDARSQSRVREIAAANIIEATAQMRTERANKHNTRPAVELRELQPKGLVDIWFEPTTKDVKGWRGPAEIATVNAADGNITVRYQGRSLDRQINEVRHHIPYLVYFSALHFSLVPYWIELRDFAENLPAGTSKTFGLILDLRSQQTGWKLTRATETAEGKMILEAAMVLAHTALHLTGFTTVRLARGCSVLQPLHGFVFSELWFWQCVLEGGSKNDTPDIFESQRDDMKLSVPVKQLVCDTHMVRSGRARWQDFGVIQFLCAPSEDLQGIADTRRCGSGGHRG